MQEQKKGSHSKQVISFSEGESTGWMNTPTYFDFSALMVDLLSNCLIATIKQVINVD